MRAAACTHVLALLASPYSTMPFIRLYLFNLSPPFRWALSLCRSSSQKVPRYSFQRESQQLRSGLAGCSRATSPIQAADEPPPCRHWPRCAASPIRWLATPAAPHDLNRRALRRPASSIAESAHTECSPPYVNLRPSEEGLFSFRELCLCRILDPLYPKRPCLERKNK